MVRPLIPALIGLLVLAGCETIPVQPPETRDQLHARALAACPTLLRAPGSKGYSQDDCTCLADRIKAEMTEVGAERPSLIPLADAKVIADTMSQSDMSMDRVSDAIRVNVTEFTQSSMAQCYGKDDAMYDMGY